MKTWLLTLCLLAITAPAAAVEDQYLATADGFSVAFDAAQLTGVSQPLEVAVWPSAGTLEIKAGGLAFVYAPDPGFVGVDGLQLNAPGAVDDPFWVRISVAPARIPVAGDWNCDGVTELGRYDSGEMRLYLYDANVRWPTWYEYRYLGAEPGWLPFAGNFDGDGGGCEEPGLYDPATGSFHLFLLPSPPPLPRGAEVGWLEPYEEVVYGPLGAGETPLAGAWNGGSPDGLGLFLPGDPGLFLLWTGDPQTNRVDAIAFGAAGSRPVTGDWNGDGTETIGVYVAHDLEFLLHPENSSSGSDEVLQVTGATGQLPVAGAWEGDGVSLGLFDAEQGWIVLYQREPDFVLAPFVEVVVAKPSGGIEPPKE